MKGSYVLLIELKEDTTIKVGKLGKIFFKKGFYAYIGSALNGIEQRIQRHIRTDKKTHWHIDYLLKHAIVRDVFYKESNNREECNIAHKLNEKLESVPSFGCSDCSCKSHLFCGSKRDILQIVRDINMQNT